MTKQTSTVYIKTIAGALVTDVYTLTRRDMIMTFKIQDIDRVNEDRLFTRDTTRTMAHDLKLHSQTSHRDILNHFSISCN